MLPILICLFHACKWEADEIPLNRPFERSFYVQGEWRDTLPNTIFTPFDYTIGQEVDPPFVNQYFSKNRTSSANGFKTIQCNLLGTSSTNPLFFVRFSKPGTDSIWTESELKELFIPGRSFPITGAPGEVEIGFEIPWFVNLFWVSESWNAQNPSGEVKIISADPYEWEATNGAGNLKLHKGMVVKFQFQTNLGRLVYRQLELRVVGDAALRAGEAALFFEYQAD